MIGVRFLDALTTKRRETQDKLAETAIDEARKKREQSSTTSAQQNGSAISAPATPATTPTAPPTTGIREGTNTLLIAVISEGAGNQLAIVIIRKVSYFKQVNVCRVKAVKAVEISAFRRRLIFLTAF